MYSYALDLIDAHIARLEREIFCTRQRIRVHVRLMKEMSSPGQRHDATMAVLRCLLNSQSALRSTLHTEMAVRETMTRLFYTRHTPRGYADRTRHDTDNLWFG